MKTLFKVIIFSSFLILTGCFDAKTKQIQDNPGPVIKTELIKREDVKEALGDKTDALSKKIDQTQNAIQTNMQSFIGASVGKLADSLAKIDFSVSTTLQNKIGDIKNKLSASVASNNELRAILKSQIDLNTTLQAQMTAIVQTNAKLEAQLAAQIGINNKIETKIDSMKQSFSAGGDIHSSNVQFNQNMLDALKSANKVSTTAIINLCYTICGLAAIASSIISGILHTRNKNLNKELETERRKLQRAIALMPPQEATRVLE